MGLIIIGCLKISLEKCSINQGYVSVNCMLHCTRCRAHLFVVMACRPSFRSHMTSHEQTKMDDSIQDIGLEDSFSSFPDDSESEYVVYLFEGEEE